MNPYGGVEEAPDEAIEYLKTWHGSLPGMAKQGFVSVVTLPSTVSAPLRLDGVLGALESEGLWPVISGSWARRDLQPQSVYVGAAYQKSPSKRGKRGGKELFGKAPGPWADCDIRKSGFADWAAVMQLVDRFGEVGLPPSIVAFSGAGGHLYWHVGAPGEGLGPEVEELGHGLRLWAERETGISLDSCENRDRILRLPGSIHWPKKIGSGEVPTACSLVRCEERWAPVERVSELTAGVLGEWQARTRETRALYRARDDRAERDIRNFRALTGAADDDDSWGHRYDLAHAEEEFAMSVSWKSILEGKGWTRNGDPDAEGRQEWARPGADSHSGRSMITDWRGSPDVASLLSRAPETGLLRLYDSRIPLTKARVAAELWTGGDMARLLTEGMARR